MDTHKVDTRRMDKSSSKKNKYKNIYNAKHIRIQEKSNTLPFLKKKNL